MSAALNSERSHASASEGKATIDHIGYPNENPSNQIADSLVGRGNPNLKTRFRFFTRPERSDLKRVYLDVIIPIKLVFFPIVLWAAFSTGFAANALLALNLTQSQAFAAPPYNFSPSSVGYANFALLVGGVLGMVTAGPLSDKISMWSTRRNNGIREPEMRLPALIPYVMATIVGMTVREHVLLAVGCFLLTS